MAQLINYPDRNDAPAPRGEIRAAAATGDNKVTEHFLQLKCVIKETLRSHAPVPLLMPRETMEYTELLGYHGPARTRVVINAWAIGRDPATRPHADEFVPERFAGDPTDLNVLGHDFRFVPFGAGRRGCPGAGFALPSIELSLASLLYHFDWELPAGGASTMNMSELYGLSVRLKATLHLVANRGL